jgi:putative addiction module component (TIGR02574 family)
VGTHSHLVLADLRREDYSVRGAPTPTGLYARGFRIRERGEVKYRPPSDNRASRKGWVTAFAMRTKLLHNLLDSISNSVNDPPMSLATIRNEIEKLEPAERASLIDLLWDSLDDDSVQEIEAKWAAESEDRIDAFERGELAAVEGPAALAELRSSLKK